MQIDAGRFVEMKEEREDAAAKADAMSGVRTGGQAAARVAVQASLATGGAAINFLWWSLLFIRMNRIIDSEQSDTQGNDGVVPRGPGVVADPDARDRQRAHRPRPRRRRRRGADLLHARYRGRAGGDQGSSRRVSPSAVRTVSPRRITRSNHH